MINGKPVDGVIADILALNPEIERLKLVTTGERSYGVGRRLLIDRLFAGQTSEADAAAQEAAELANNWRISFSTAALGVAISLDRPLLSEAASALRHHNAMSPHSEINSADWSEKIKGLLKAKTTASMIALSSLVKCRGGRTAHIPMLDLGCDNSENGKASAVSALRSIGEEGYLLNSGKSFHFYGKKLLSPEEFTKFLGRAALFSPIVDAAWIAHQLIESAAALRMSNKAGYTRRPYLLCKI